MPSKLRVGVLGAGAWARSAHIPGWQRDPRCEVVAVCDVVKDRAEAWSADIPEVTDDWQQLVGRSDIDVIDIVTPSHTHYELASAALEAGKHVLCEKPVAYDFRSNARRRHHRPRERAEDKARVHVPLQPGCPVRALAARRRLRRHAVHLQRLRAELAVARPPGAAAPAGPECRPIHVADVVAGGLRRADHRHRPLVGRRRSGAASSARCATSFPSAWCARRAA